MSNQPAKKFRVGNVHVTVWKNIDREKGTTWYSSVPARSYKNGDDTWKEVTSFTGDENLILAELLRQAWTWGVKQQQADYEARKTRENAANGDE